MRKHPLERLDLHVIEDAVDDVRVTGNELPRRPERLRLDDDETAAPISERPRQNHLSGSGKGLEVTQVGGAMLRTLLLRVRCVVADDDEERIRLPEPVL